MTDKYQIVVDIATKIINATNKDIDDIMSKNDIVVKYLLTECGIKANSAKDTHNRLFKYPIINAFHTGEKKYITESGIKIHNISPAEKVYSDAMPWPPEEVAKIREDYQQKKNARVPSKISAENYKHIIETLETHTSKKLVEDVVYCQLNLGRRLMEILISKFEEPSVVERADYVKKMKSSFGIDIDPRAVVKYTTDVKSMKKTYLIPSLVYDKDLLPRIKAIQDANVPEKAMMKRIAVIKEAWFKKYKLDWLGDEVRNFQKFRPLYMFLFAEYKYPSSMNQNGKINLVSTVLGHENAGSSLSYIDLFEREEVEDDLDRIIREMSN